MAAILQIVSAVGSTTVWFDLNGSLSAGAKIGRGANLTLGGVSLEQAVDGAADAWSVASPTLATERAIEIPVVIFGASPDALQTQISNLMALTQQTWVLRIRRDGATADSWLRCRACIPQVQTRITSDRPGILAVGSITTVTEPYAHGARVDLTGISVSGDPNNAGYGRAVVNNVGGDALTPAMINFSDLTVTGAPHDTLISVRRRGVPGALAGLVTEGESAATGTPVGGATYAVVVVSGASTGQTAEVTFSGAAYGSYVPLTYAFALSGAEAIGTYRLIGRFRRLAGSAGVEHLIERKWGSYQPINISLPAGGNDDRILDMGLFQVPVGQLAQPYAPMTLLGATTPSLRIRAFKATAGAGKLQLDWLMLVPADAEMGRLKQAGGALTSGRQLLLDGYSNTAVVASNDPFSSGVWAGPPTGTTIVYEGAVPKLRPGDNTLFVIPGLQTATPSWTFPNFAVNVSYWPRYTWVR